MKVVYFADSRDNRICQNLLLASNFLKTCAPARNPSVCSTEGQNVFLSADCFVEAGEVNTNMYWTILCRHRNHVRPGSPWLRFSPYIQACHISGWEQKICMTREFSISAVWLSSRLAVAGLGSFGGKGSFCFLFFVVTASISLSVSPLRSVCCFLLLMTALPCWTRFVMPKPCPAAFCQRLVSPSPTKKQTTICYVKI